MYTLYVIPGSHACRSAMLMLEYKQVAYRRVEVVTMLHPIAARLHGFDAGGQTRSIGGRRPPALRIADRLGTVPGLASDGQRVSTNHRIARFLDERHPEPPLLPTDPELRSAVEETERWANDTLQMNARRIMTAAVRRDPSTASRLGANGRLGHLLYRSALLRRILIPTVVCSAFAPSPATERALLAELPATLDRIDGWIADGILGQAQLNVADFMVAPSRLAADGSLRTAAVMIRRASIWSVSFAQRSASSTAERRSGSAGKSGGCGWRSSRKRAIPWLVEIRRPLAASAGTVPRRSATRSASGRRPPMLRVWPPASNPCSRAATGCSMVTTSTRR